MNFGEMSAMLICFLLIIAEIACLKTGETDLGDVFTSMLILSILAAIINLTIEIRKGK